MYTSNAYTLTKSPHSTSTDLQCSYMYTNDRPTGRQIEVIVNMYAQALHVTYKLLNLDWQSDHSNWHPGLAIV